MGIALDWFQLDPSWSCIFQKLPWWRCGGENIWSDGWSVVELSPLRGSQPEFGFTISETAHSVVISERLGSPNLNNRQQLTCLRTPSGIPVRFCAAAKSAHPQNNRSLWLNHISLNVDDVMREMDWFEEVMGPSVVLARDAAWEPVSGQLVRDAHLFRSPWFYVTIRESKQASVDHIGWMAMDQETVLRMADVVDSLDWKIVYGPAVVDSSFLFHFEGPDGRVHDFFYPIRELLREK